MSRTVIAAVVAAVIAVLTAIAYFVTSTSFEARVQRDADAQLTRAHQVIQQLNQLEGIDIANKAERLAALPEFAKAITTENSGMRQSQARIGFQKFVSDEKQGDVKPDIIALLGPNGDILAMNDVPSNAIVPKQWKDAKGDSVIPAVNIVLVKKVIISDIWNFGEKGMMKVGIAPVMDPDAAPNPKDPDGVPIIGAIVVAYAQTAEEARRDRELLGTEIAYFDNKHVIASSFTLGGGRAEDTAKARQLSEKLAANEVGIQSGKKPVTIDGVDYLAAVVSMPRKSTKALPASYPAITAGAIVLAPASDSGKTSSTVQLFIVLLGGGALAIALLGLYLAHRRLIAQVDQVEQGVTDIINGNLDRTFRPVGMELDGLANGLNVMLARLLGRPEPGEEEYDDDGNPIMQGRVEFDEGDGSAPAPDPDLAALAQESEPDYYKRVYTEYLAARKATGNPDEVSFENFIAKLKVNEGKLKAQHQCRAVRFRVVTKDGKVTLKPVPIFA
ncbi:MAG: MXAN_5187 C-terminal domain-containing protein [Kofleriaceae bacterium]